MINRWACIAALCLCAGAASGTPLILDYTGFSWSRIADGQPATFSAVGVLDGFSEPVNLSSEVYTFHLGDLALTSVTILSPSTRRYSYSGGDLGIFRSTGPANRPYDYGVNPADATTPATFVDGVEWLGGALTDFTVTINIVLNLGTLSAAGQFTRGEFASQLAGNPWFSFAGLTGRSGNGIPTGYRYRLDGQATSEINLPVPEPSAALLLVPGLVGLAVLRKRQNP
jgi:hypothetical protein